MFQFSDIGNPIWQNFPTPIKLTTRPDLGESQGKLVTIDDYHELFYGILNPKQIDGLRLLVTPFPQQQFNQTEDRRSKNASRGGDAVALVPTRSRFSRLCTISLGRHRERRRQFKRFRRRSHRLVEIGKLRCFGIGRDSAEDLHVARAGLRAGALQVLFGAARHFFTLR